MRYPAVLRSLGRRGAGGLLVLAVLALSSATACTGGNDDEDAVASLPAGSMTVATKRSITGQSGKILVVLVTTAGGEPVARVCAAINSNDFTLSPTAFRPMPKDPDPCAGSTETAVFAAGDYQVTAAIQVPSTKKPEKQEIRQVSMEEGGRRAVTLDGATLSASK